MVRPFPSPAHTKNSRRNSIERDGRSRGRIVDSARRAMRAWVAVTGSMSTLSMLEQLVELARTARRRRGRRRRSLPRGTSRGSRHVVGDECPRERAPPRPPGGQDRDNGGGVNHHRGGRCARRRGTPSGSSGRSRSAGPSWPRWRPARPIAAWVVRLLRRRSRRSSFSANASSMTLVIDSPVASASCLASSYTRSFLIFSVGMARSPSPVGCHRDVPRFFPGARTFYRRLVSPASARWPPQAPPAQQVQVGVEDDLPASQTGVEDQSIADRRCPRNRPACRP